MRKEEEGYIPVGYELGGEEIEMARLNGHEDCSILRLYGFSLKCAKSEDGGRRVRGRMKKNRSSAEGRENGMQSK